MILWWLNDVMMVLVVGVEDCGYVFMEFCIVIYVVKVFFFFMVCVYKVVEMSFVSVNMWFLCFGWNMN